MVLEHLKGPSLKVWLSEAGAFDKILARFYSSCLLSALEHLHLIIGATHGSVLSSDFFYLFKNKDYIKQDIQQRFMSG